MDFSLTTLFVAPVGQTALPSTGSTQDLTAGQIGIFDNSYNPVSTDIADKPYFYVAQGRENNYLQGSKRSDKISASKIVEWYKVAGSPVASNQITDISGWDVKVGEEVTVSLRAHSSYIDTLYFNGFTRSITVPATCIECDGDPCEKVDVETLVDAVIAKFELANSAASGVNPDNISFADFFTFERVGEGDASVLRIHGIPLTKRGVPCDVAAEPHEYDRMWFKAWAHKGADTTADFLTADACQIVSTSTNLQEAGYATGTSEEIAQLEKNFYSYQAGYLKHLFRNAGYNQNFEGYTSTGTSYDTFYIKFNEVNPDSANWAASLSIDSTVIIAVESGSDLAIEIEEALSGALGTITVDNTVYTTTTTTTVAV